MWMSFQPKLTETSNKNQAKSNEIKVREDRVQEKKAMEKNANINKMIEAGWWWDVWNQFKYALCLCMDYFILD